MGRCESATVSTGIKILLGDLLDQITDENEDLISEMLEKGFIEDENETLNENFIGSLDEPNEDLLENYLLVPVSNVLETARWGWGREGINGISTDFYSIQEPNLEKYKGLKNIKIVFILEQYSG